MNPDANAKNQAGYISLERIAERLNVLVVQCDRCGRRGQYPLEADREVRRRCVDRAAAE